MAKQNEKLLKAEREQQVIEFWEESYSNKCEPILFGKTTASEIKKDKDGFYLYKVTAYLPDSKQYNFDYYAEFENNKMI